MSAPDFVVAGHVVRDLAPDGWRLGGTVTFAAVQAHRLGLSVGVVTSAAADLDLSELAFAAVVRAPSPVTTSFENVYSGGQRRQRVPARAGPIDLRDVPDAWRRAPIVLLGPVLGELGTEGRQAFAEGSLVGVSAQGWLRTVDQQGHVVPTLWTGQPFWRGCNALFVSDEDLAGDEDLLVRWTREVPIVAVTASSRGARVHDGPRWRSIDAFPQEEVDPTGAGDTFATAFLVRLHETRDVADAARFGAAAASLSVGAAGAAAIAGRDAIEARIRRYPEIALR